MLNFVALSRLALWLLLVVAGSAQAHHLVPVHELNCSKDFPCPAELQRRIDFWIEVFKTWDKKQAVFHDPEVPHRVYSVVETGQGCSSRVKSTINRERKRIKSALYNTAKKLKNGGHISREQRHLAQLFPEGKADDLHRAAENIRCQSGVRDNYLAGLERFSRYQYMVDTVLAQYKLPPDIRYLPFVESSYNPAAYSKAGAAGMWQIMPRTARTLGLELNATVDERLDPEMATHGAARYLVNARKSLTQLARSIDPEIHDEQITPFVITSYNYGVNGMRRAIKTVEPDYLRVLERYKSPAFRVAVKNFYASFLAARHVTLNAERYFGQVKTATASAPYTFVLEYPVSMARVQKVFDVSEHDLRPLNLGLTRFIWHGWRLIPAGYQLRLPGREGGYAREEARLRTLEPETVAAVGGEYVVRKGDTACAIARALAVNCREFIRINGLGSRALIRIGQKLVVPGKLEVVAEPSTRGPDKIVIREQVAPTTPQTHKVRKGDTACGIAERYGIRCKQLIAANRLGRKAVIYVGQKLRIPGAVVASKSKIAGLDENNRYLVRQGDYACTIARRFAVSCKELISINRLNKQAVIFPGQRLRIPGLEVPATSETAHQLAQLEQSLDAAAKTTEQPDKPPSNPDLINLLDTLPDLSISVSNVSGNPRYRIWVEADETLGHYADWLGLRSTHNIRQLNQFKPGEVLRIGQLLELPVQSADQVDAFEKKRGEYHQVLNEELKSHYRLTRISRYQVKNADSVWSLANESGFPVWLFYRLNPELKITRLRAGQTVLLPVLERL